MRGTCKAVNCRVAFPELAKFSLEGHSASYAILGTGTAAPETLYYSSSKYRKFGGNLTVLTYSDNVSLFAIIFMAYRRKIGTACNYFYFTKLCWKLVVGSVILLVSASCFVFD